MDCDQQLIGMVDYDAIVGSVESVHGSLIPPVRSKVRDDGEDMSMHGVGLKCPCKRLC